MLMLFLHFSFFVSTLHLGALPKNKNMILEGPQQVAQKEDAQKQLENKTPDEVLFFPLPGQRQCTSPFTSPSLAESEVGAVFAGGLGRVGRGSVGLAGRGGGRGLVGGGGVQPAP